MAHEPIHANEQEEGLSVKSYALLHVMEKPLQLERHTQLRRNMGYTLMVPEVGDGLSGVHNAVLHIVSSDTKPSAAETTC